MHKQKNEEVTDSAKNRTLRSLLRAVKKTKPGLVASYDNEPRNGEGLFLFRTFINLSLTYIYTYPLSPGPHTGVNVTKICPQVSN